MHSGAEKIRTQMNSQSGVDFPVEHAPAHNQIEGDARLFFSGTVYIILDFQL